MFKVGLFNNNNKHWTAELYAQRAEHPEIVLRNILKLEVRRLLALGHRGSMTLNETCTHRCELVALNVTLFNLYLK